MIYIKFFEEFTEQTLKTNNDTYNGYLRFKTRQNKVAWFGGSQIKNFHLVNRFIKDNDSILDYGCGIGDFIKYLNSHKKISNYLGVDINENYINLAKKSYPTNNFQLIKNINELNGKWDSVCVIGVFTWFITKDDFIKTINKLYEVSNRQILLTCLHDSDIVDTPSYWLSNYRYYSEEIFTELFPHFDIEFIHHETGTMLVKINK